MESSMRLTLMTAFAVSGSMVLLVHQVHKHLFDDFMKKFEYEIRGSTKHQTKKRVRFAKDVFEIPMEKSDHMNMVKAQQVEDEKVLIKDGVENWKHEEKVKDMPLNRLVLYKGIMKNRSLKGTFGF
ncbi:hypothetical protein RJT34_23803 [Clitoria ternatea]|uniref:Uncharacterized protein n=1 Tax=Clitoria ternatea TaxID=43366 RepID=A0AAN9IGW6_CLITE